MDLFFVLGLVTFSLPDNIAYVHGKALAALYSQLEGRVLHAVNVWCISIIGWFLAVSALEGGLKLEEALKNTQVLPDLEED